jgi:hypothetical protein
VKTSETTVAVFAALAKAQAAMRPVVKDRTAKVQTKTGGGYSFDYADLGSVLDSVKPALNANGIAIVQAAGIEGDRVVVETRLAHASGEWLESALAMKPDDLSPQKVGSAVTYARRYALSAMVGVFSEEDDDGNAAQGNTREVKRKSAAKPGPAPLDPVMRKAEALAWIEERFPGKVRGELARVLGRTFPDKEEIKITAKELETIEGWITLAKATESKERTPAEEFNA